jgi:hypothetical protein
MQIAILAWGHKNQIGLKAFKVQYPHGVHKTHIGVFPLQM